MPVARHLTTLAEIVEASLPARDAINEALPALRSGLEARDVFLVYGSGVQFRYFGTCDDIGLSDVALWIVHRDLTTRAKPNTFCLDDDEVRRFATAQPGTPCDFVGARVPVPQATGEMVVARGPWPQGLPEASLDFLRAALPAVALLLDRQIDSSRAERQRNQLTALANLNRVISQSEDLEPLLTGIASTMSTILGIDYVSIDLVNDAGEVTLRCVNLIGPEVSELRDRWVRGASRHDPVRDEVLRTRRAMLFPDAQNDERIPESGRNYFIRSLIVSTGVFPLVTKDDVLGVISIASHRPLAFTAQEVEIIEGMAIQVATAVQGVRLYQELAESRRQLNALNAELQRRMGIEHHLARTDPTTGIPNRRFIDEALETECQRASRYGHPVSIVAVDLDHFKEINDRFGHNSGDETLRHLAQLARQTCRDVDIVGRYGGDEFIFVLPSTTLAEATEFAERFRQALARRFPRDVTGGSGLTASLGVAQWEGPDDDPASIVRRADQALYAAKQAGRNRTVAAEPGSAAVA